jgi:dTDP-4-amino-4,6-dideoxygalactose transaminase
MTDNYNQLLNDKIYRPKLSRDVKPNYAYYPVVFKSEAKLLKAFKKLNDEQIFPRRYFYPSLNKLPYVSDQKCPTSEDISLRVACLPLYADLEVEIIKEIARIVNEV